MQGALDLSTFSDAQFDEAAFEAQLTGTDAHDDLLVLDHEAKARFLSGDYAEALAAPQSEGLLWSSPAISLCSTITTTRR